MDISTQAEHLRREIYESIAMVGLDRLKQKKDELARESQKPDFWTDSGSAQTTMKNLANLEASINEWESLEKGISEVYELSKLNDASLEADLTKQIKSIKKRFENKRVELAFSGPYDDHDVLLGIYAGAGGTDAQDWAQMLLRMYTRWAESTGNKIKILDESSGEEAGIKSATLLIEGANAYGKLRGENGVHRLVRQSPFNADAKRQTSFARIEIVPKIDEPEELPIDEKDLKIDVFRAGGHGGQSVNTTDSAVRITHLPTGIAVNIQNERSQIQNRETALTILRSRLAQLQLEQHAEKINEIKGPNEQAAWGNQIRSYVLHPYKMVKDLRTSHETSNVDAVLDGQLNDFIDADLKSRLNRS